MTQPTSLACACGKVRLEVGGAPIVSSECCCESCREAGSRLQRLPGAPRRLGPDGNTRFVLYRKDRVRFLAGAELLRAFRLKPGSSSRRVVASCCNTPMFLEFENGHWLSVYGVLWPDGALPPLEMRTMARDLPAGVALPGDVPNARTQSLAHHGAAARRVDRDGFPGAEDRGGRNDRCLRPTTGSRSRTPIRPAAQAA